MSRKLQAPRGTFDVQPADARRRLRLERVAAELLGRSGYEPFSTPIFEDTELFARGVGESTDVVQKEMFTFEDKAGRSLTLRPEATAAICRAYVEHGMHKLPQPVKLWTSGPFFRHEAPQAGRYRQFTQLDIEALGSDDPSIDAEQILLLDEFLRLAGAGETRLLLSSLGTPETRAAYLEELRGHLRSRESELSEEVRDRLDLNPLRAFDADHPGTQAVMRDAPRLLDRLGPEDLEHFAEVRALLDEAGLELRGRHDARARARLLHAHGLRVRQPGARGRAEHAGGRRPLRPAGRAAGRPAYAGDRLGRGDRADPAGRAGRRGRLGRARVCGAGHAGGQAPGVRVGAGAARTRHPHRARAGRALAEGAAAPGRPDRSARGGHRRRGDRRQGSGERRADRGRRARTSWSSGSRSCCR